MIDQAKLLDHQEFLLFLPVFPGFSMIGQAKLLDHHKPEEK